MSASRGNIVDMSEDDRDSVTSDYGKQSSAASVSEEDIEPVGSFTCFPKLPAEIRLKIWKAALPGPRVLRMLIKFEGRQPDIEGQKRKPQVARFVASHPPPVGLHVCRESRIEALKDYELSFPTKTTPAHTYVNFKLDTLFLDTLASYFPHTNNTMMNNSTTRKRRNKPVILHKEFSKVRFLIIDERCVWFTDRVFPNTHFPSLETISLFVSGPSTSHFKRCSWDIEEREAPEEPERSHQVVEWIKSWVKRMENLARKADAKNPKPEIRFVRLVEGSGRKEAKDEKSDAKEGEKAGTNGGVEEVVGGLI